MMIGWLIRIVSQSQKYLSNKETGRTLNGNVKGQSIICGVATTSVREYRPLVDD